MKRSHRCLIAASAAFAMTAVLAPAATAADDGAPSYPEFKAATYRDLDRQYIVNGDEALKNEKELRAYYDRMVKPKSQKDGLIVNTVGGTTDKWSSSQVGNLTYCVSNTFGTDKAAIVSAMNQGTAIWENASSAIDFRHVTTADSSCNTRNTSVVFSVEPTFTTQYIARAFFPSTSKSGRNILVNANALQNSGSWTPGNIMGHELGHTLGFRHEHTRPEAGTCFEDNNWRPLTPYDSASIMHYPQCNGSSSNLSFTATDAQGVRALYGG